MPFSDIRESLHGIARKSMEKAVLDGKPRIGRETQALRPTGFAVFSGIRSPEWGSGGRWFESSRPDNARAVVTESCDGPLLFHQVDDRRVGQ